MSKLEILTYFFRFASHFHFWNFLFVYILFQDNLMLRSAFSTASYVKTYSFFSLSRVYHFDVCIIAVCKKLENDYCINGTLENKIIVIQHLINQLKLGADHLIRRADNRIGGAIIWKENVCRALANICMQNESMRWVRNVVYFCLLTKDHYYYSCQTLSHPGSWPGLLIQRQRLLFQ